MPFHQPKERREIKSYMKLQVMFSDGRIREVAVRYHDSGGSKGLWTCEASIERYIEFNNHRLGDMTTQKFINSMCCASAPFKVYSGDWGENRCSDEINLLKTVIFSDLDWENM